MVGPEEGIYASSASQLVSSTAQEVSSAFSNYDNLIQNSEQELAQSQIKDESFNLLMNSTREECIIPSTDFMSHSTLTQNSEQERALPGLDKTALDCFILNSGKAFEKQSWNTTNSNEIMQQNSPNELKESRLDDFSFLTKTSPEAHMLNPESQNSSVGFSTPLTYQPYDPEIPFDFENFCPLSPEAAGNTSELRCLPDFDLFGDEPIEDDVLPQECLEWAQLDQYDDDPYVSCRTSRCETLTSIPTPIDIKATPSAPNIEKLDSTSPVVVNFPTSLSSSAVSTTGAQYSLSVPKIPNIFNADLSNKTNTHPSRQCSMVVKNSVPASIVPATAKLTLPFTSCISTPLVKSTLSLATVPNKNKHPCTDADIALPSHQYFTGATHDLPVSGVPATTKQGLPTTSFNPIPMARPCPPVSDLYHASSYPTPRTSPDGKFSSQSSMPSTKGTTIAAQSICPRAPHVTKTAPEISSTIPNKYPRSFNVTKATNTTQNINPTFTKGNLKPNVPKNKYRLSRADIVRHEIATGAFRPPIPSNTPASLSSFHEIPPDLRKTFDMLVDKFYDDECFKKSTLAYITEMKEAGMKFTALEQQPPQSAGEQYSSGEVDVAGESKPRDLNGMSLEEVSAAFRELERENFRTQKNKAYWLKCAKYYESVMPPPSRTYWSCNNVNGHQRCDRRNATWELIWTRRDKCNDCGLIPSFVDGESLPSPGTGLNLTSKRQFSGDNTTNKRPRCA